MNIEMYDENEILKIIPEFFTSNEVKKELPYLQRKDRMWFVIKSGEDILAIGALKIGKTYAELKHAYVYKKHRGNRLYPKLLVSRVKWCREQGIKRVKVTTCNSKVTRKLQELNFAKIGQRGKYTQYEVEF